ncbi:MAG TPA: hemerythrin domain-containing protein [Candidatus Binataceae bacterium]|nr:hemerythrin domain-containing protein [Candidatus Binataceae bacterium]
MDAIGVAMTKDCFVRLPDLEVPMINSLVSCLTREHTKLDEQILQLALSAGRLAANLNDQEAGEHAREVGESIRRYLWSHLQIEDELVLTWGGAHHAIAHTLGETLESERQQMRKLLAAIGSHADARGNVAERESFAKSLLELSRMLATHVERYDGEVLPAIQRALFN